MPKNENKFFAANRKRFFDLIEDGVAIFPAAPVLTRNWEVEHRYRPDSDFFYLTGFCEPHSVAVLIKSGSKTRYLLFVQARNKTQEIWTGRRFGVEGAKKEFGAEEAFEIEKFDEEIVKLLKGAKRIYYKIGKDRELDEKLPKWFEKLRTQIRAGVTTPTEVIDPTTLVHEMRLHKTETEIDWMRKAAKITKEAHHQVMKEGRPGVYEYEMEALLDYNFRRLGANGWAYGSIVASGANATILHYTQNDRRMAKGDLLLVDAGAEFNYYAADVTRTFPVSGKYTKAQKAVYEAVLQVQIECMEMVKPGTLFHAIHDHSVRRLTELMVELGLLKGKVEKLIESSAYTRFYMHRAGHWLGLDVHDAGRYYREGQKSRPLEPGMVLTVEPGLYIEEGAEGVHKEFHGIGVRIEDDILVTKTGYENLTKGIAKSVKEVEEICSR